MVPSAILNLFLDRTDIEIIDQIWSEVPYHPCNSFNNQAIIGAHSATELKSTHKNGWLAQRMVLNDGILITNVDNLDATNVMFGDIIIKQYLKHLVSDHPIQFLVYNSPSVPRTELDGFYSERILKVDQRVGIFLCLTGLDQFPTNKDMTSYTTSAGVPVQDESNSPAYSPIIYPDTPIPFPMLNLMLVHLSSQETAESYSEFSNQEENSRHLPFKAQPISETIQYSTEQLKEVQEKLKLALGLETPDSQGEDGSCCDAGDIHQCPRTEKFQRCCNSQNIKS